MTKEEYTKQFIEKIKNMYNKDKEYDFEKIAKKAPVIDCILTGIAEELYEMNWTLDQIRWKKI